MIDFSDFDNINSDNSFNGDNDSEYIFEYSHTIDIPNIDDNPFSMETSGFGENSPFNPETNTLDSWETDNAFFDKGSNYDVFGSSTQKQIDLSDLENEMTFRGESHTQSDINSHIAEAKHDIADAESDIRHNTNIANSKARMGEPHSFEDSQIRNAQSRLNEARRELNKWQHMKPSK